MDHELKGLEIDGAIYKTRFTASFEKRKEWIELAMGKVYSFIPGTIIDIRVQEGDKVKKGDILILLEAMKMRNRVMAPMDGTVKLINVSMNQIVAKNALLIEVE